MRLCLMFIGEGLAAFGLVDGLTAHRPVTSMTSGEPKDVQSVIALHVSADLDPLPVLANRRII